MARAAASKATGKQLDLLFKNVKLVSSAFVTKPVGTKTPSEAIIGAIIKQIEYASNDRDGIVVDYGVNKEGNKKRPHKWYSLKGGKAYTFIRYGNQRINIFPGQTVDNAVEVGTSYDDIITFYEGLIEAAKSGELDAILAPIQAKIASYLKPKTK